MNSGYDEMGKAPLGPLIIKYSLPAIVGMLVQGLYNVVDRLFLGNGVGPDAIAGVAIAFPIMMFLMGVAMLLGMGGVTLFALLLGQQKKEEASKVLGNVVSLLTISSLVLMVVGLIFLDPLLILFGATPQILPYARSFMGILLFGTLLNSYGFGLTNFIRADGSPKTAMAIMLCGAILNTILDPIFIFIFHLGVEGAAIATLISQITTGILVLVYFSSKRCHISIQKKNLAISLSMTLKIVGLGLAPFAMNCANSFVNMILNLQLVKYGGDLSIAVMGIITSVVFLFIMPIMGINQGVAPIIGYNYGAKNYNRAKKTSKAAIAVASVIIIAAFILMQFFPSNFIGLFGQDKKMIEMGTWMVRIYILMLPVVGFQIVGSNFFQAIGKAKESLVLSLLRQVIFLIPLVLLLPGIFQSIWGNGLLGLVIATPISDGLAACVTAILYIKVMTRKDLGK